jgi:hypothetical protein
MKKRLLTCLAAAILTVPFLLFAGCSGGGGSSAPAASTTQTVSNSYLGTQSPGDVWSWTIAKDSSGSGTFLATDSTTGKTYSGNVATLPNKFLRLSITASSDSGAVGSIAYAIEFPGTALIAKPAGGNDAPVVAAAQGSCPDPGTYNWIKMPTTAWNSATDPAFGTVVTAGNASSLGFNVAAYLLGGGSAGSSTDSGTCSAGKITTLGGMTIGVTPSGVFIDDEGANGGGVGMQQPPAKIGSATILQQGKEFRGFVFMTHPPQGQDGVMPVWARTKGDGVITAGQYTNFAGGTEDTCPGGDSCAALSIGTELVPGTFTGTMEDIHTSTAHPFTLVINKINGKYMVFGFAQEQAGQDPNALYPYLLLMMEQ